MGRVHWRAERALKVLFMGTPEFAVPCLETLIRETEVCAVVTQPGRPRGRGLKTSPSAVASVALAARLPVLTPAKIRDEAFLKTVAELSPDAIVVAAYGKILPASLLEMAPLGGINAHASLLPRHRGAAPIAAAILAGDSATGITIMQMNERMDAGDILLQKELPVGRDETAGSLHDKLKALAAEALAEALAQIRSSGIEGTPQDEAQATLAPMIKKEDGKIDWEEAAVTIERRVRAYSPWPSAYTMLGGKHLKIIAAEVAGETRSAARSTPAGTILRASPSGIEVATGRGALVVKKLQLEGRRPLDAAAFLAGAKLQSGARLG